ncbi:MAG TPA: peptidyl-tRNA hydrolase Pth2 [Streptosporangiaceae bacterium]|nr:peptidyl-tRNA hydrolase Pth2 [Streptosporangiaceae bacterium]
MKLALLVRTDLGMGRGKIAAQVAHAAVAAVLASGQADLAAWLADGQAKVVLRVADGEHLLDLARQAAASGLTVEVVRDAGRTQVAAGTATCCAIGPAGDERVDAVTGELPLL